MRRLPQLLGPNVISGVLISEAGSRVSDRRRCDNGSRGWSNVIADFDDGGKDHEPKNAASSTS